MSLHDVSFWGCSLNSLMNRLMFVTLLFFGVYGFLVGFEVISPPNKCSDYNEVIEFHGDRLDFPMFFVMEYGRNYTTKTYHLFPTIAEKNTYKEGLNGE